MPVILDARYLPSGADLPQDRRTVATLSAQTGVRFTSPYQLTMGGDPMIGRSNKEPEGFDARTAISPPHAMGAKVWGTLRAATGWLSQKLRAATAQIWDKLRTAIGSLFGFLARRGVAGTLAAGGAMALGAAIGRYRAAGFDSEV